MSNPERDRSADPSKNKDDIVKDDIVKGDTLKTVDNKEPPPQPLVAVIMGSTSDWETMQHAAVMLTRFGAPHVCQVVSAHRTPAEMAAFSEGAVARGLEVIIAGAGGAAHLPGMVAAQTTLPVLGVPVQSKALNGLDSLLSIVQMPAGVPVATLAIGRAGAINAALLAVAILATSRPELRGQLERFRDEQAERVKRASLPTLTAEEPV